jgi:hypothetical protein
LTINSLIIRLAVANTIDNNYTKSSRYANTLYVINHLQALATHRRQLRTSILTSIDIDNIPITTTNLFKGPSDWSFWIVALRSEAKAYAVWEYIDPNSTRMKPSAPRKPKVGDYEKQIDPRTRVVAASEEAVDYAYQATNSTELTAKGLALFQFDIGLYRSALKRYKEITTRLGIVVTWITNHLATGQNKHFCGNEETIREGLK